MGFSVGFGSKKGSSSGKSTTTFTVGEDSEKDILTQALTKAQQSMTSQEQQSLSSLMQSMGLTNTVTQQQQEQQTQQTQNTTQQTNQTQTGQQQELVKQSAFADQDIAKIRELVPGIFGQAQANYEIASGGNLPAQIAAIQRQLSEKVLPGIVSEEAGAGSYNTTSKTLLANDAIARGAELAAVAQVDAARTGGQALSPIMQLSEILKGAESTSAGNVTNNTSLSGTSNTQQQTAIQQLLQALTQTQEQTQQTQVGTQTQNTTGSQQSTSQESTAQRTEEDASTDQTGTSTTKSKGKTKSSGFSVGYG